MTQTNYNYTIRCATTTFSHYKPGVASVRFLANHKTGDLSLTTKVGCHSSRVLVLASRFYSLESRCSVSGLPGLVRLGL